jgi:hypothetical protein
MARVLCEHGPCAVWAWPVCCVSMARVLTGHECLMARVSMAMVLARVSMAMVA